MNPEAFYKTYVIQRYYSRWIRHYNVILMMMCETMPELQWYTL